MNLKEFRELTRGLPETTEVFIRGSGVYSTDDAWSAELRCFRDAEEIVLFIQTPDEPEHRNYPEGYGGVEEVTLPVDKK